MYSSVIALSTVSVTMAASLPAGQLSSRSNGPPGSFHLIGQTSAQPATTFPLTALFPAVFNLDLRIYASTTGTPYSNTTSFSYTPQGSLETVHSTVLSPSEQDPFYSLQPTADDILTLRDGSTAEGGLTYVDDSSADALGYFIAGGAGQFAWSLCDGDAVDQQLGRKLIYFQGTDTSCQAVSLQAVP